MIFNTDAINWFYRSYLAAGATLNESIKQIFKEIFENGNVKKVCFNPVAVKPSTPDELVQVSCFTFKDNKLMFYTTDDTEYTFEQIGYKPSNMYLIYKSVMETIKN